MKRIGEIVKELREEKGLLLRQVASKIEMDTTLLSRIERAERMPTKEQVIRLARFFSADENQFLIAYFSDKLVYEVHGEEVALKALQVAEKKVFYLSKK